MKQLLAGLESWSPLDRGRSAEELGKREDDVLPQLLELTRSKNPNARLGAVAALGAMPLGKADDLEHITAFI